jgi:hypothetical protein
MKPGTVPFLGEAGRHRNLEGMDCPGRQFLVRVRGVGGSYTNKVECTACHRWLDATDDGLVRWTSVRDVLSRTGVGTGGAWEPPDGVPPRAG